MINALIIGELRYLGNLNKYQYLFVISFYSIWKLAN